MADTDDRSRGGSNKYILFAAACIIGLLALLFFLLLNNPREDTDPQQDSRGDVGIEAPESGQGTTE